MLSSILASTTNEVTILQVVQCTLVSIILGIIVSYVYMYRNTYNKSFAMTLAVLPILVQSIIMLVNGNLGTGVAVMGAFSLVRFRSVAGGSREIACIFWAMSIGLATGMGYIIYTIALSVCIAIVYLGLSVSSFGTSQKYGERQIKIVIPEDLDYPGLFDGIFSKYTKQANLDNVKTTNMGSLYELTYHVTFIDLNQEKALLDELRTRNGNLTVSSGKIATNKDEL